MTSQSTDSDLDRENKSLDSNPWWHLYIFLAGLAGALSLARITDDIIAWHGFFKFLAAAWTEFVRPIAEYLFAWLFDYFRIEMPDLVKDYLAVGVISMVGATRVAFYSEHESTVTGITEYADATQPAFWARLTFWLLILLTAWPIAIPGYVAIAFFDRPLKFAIKETYFLGSTFVYFGVLLVANYALLHPDALALR